MTKQHLSKTKFFSAVFGIVLCVTIFAIMSSTEVFAWAECPSYVGSGGGVLEVRERAPSGCTYVAGTSTKGEWRKLGRMTYETGRCGPSDTLILYTSAYQTEYWRIAQYDCGEDDIEWYRYSTTRFCCFFETSCGHAPYDWGESCGYTPPPPPLPDLIPWGVWVSYDGYINAGYRNYGNADAGPNHADLYIDGVKKDTADVRSLKAGYLTGTIQFKGYDWICSGSSDTIRVCVR